MGIEPTADRFCRQNRLPDHSALTAQHQGSLSELLRSVDGHFQCRVTRISPKLGPAAHQEGSVDAFMGRPGASGLGLVGSKKTW